MPRALLITFCYPPIEVIGSIRPAALAKYLPQNGWDVQVLTVRRDGVFRSAESITETGYSDVLQRWKSRLHLDRKRTLHEQLGLSLSSKPRTKRLHTKAFELARYVLTYPDPTKGWVSHAVDSLKQIKQHGPGIDAIITTSPPISAHLIGYQAKRILSSPWIADLRDLWTQNLAGDSRALQVFETRLEKRTLGFADALVSVSVPWADKLRERYSDKTVYPITNGFDPDDFPQKPALTRQFTITYAGRLYEGRRDPSPLFEVVRDLLKEGAVSADDLRLRFYGPSEPWLSHVIARYGVERVVELNGVIPHREAIQCEAESQLLLLLGWSDPREIGQHSGKLFEYFGASRPILAVGGTRSVLTEALEETQAGTHVFSKEQLRGFVVRSYEDYKRFGEVRYQGNKQAMAQYSHPEMARKFAKVLNQIANFHSHNQKKTSPDLAMVSMSE